MDIMHKPCPVCLDRSVPIENSELMFFFWATLALQALHTAVFMSELWAAQRAHVARMSDLTTSLALDILALSILIQVAAFPSLNILCYVLDYPGPRQRSAPVPFAHYSAARS